MGDRTIYGSAGGPTGTVSDFVLYGSVSGALIPDFDDIDWSQGTLTYRGETATAWTFETDGPDGFMQFVCHEEGIYSIAVAYQVVDGTGMSRVQMNPLGDGGDMSMLLEREDTVFATADVLTYRHQWMDIGRCEVGSLIKFVMSVEPTWPPSILRTMQMQIVRIAST